MESDPVSSGDTMTREYYRSWLLQRESNLPVRPVRLTLVTGEASPRSTRRPGLAGGLAHRRLCSLAPSEL